MPEPINLDSKTKRPPRGESPPRSNTKSQSTKSESERLRDEAIKGKNRSPADKKLQVSIAQGYGYIGMALMGIGTRFKDSGLANTGVATINGAEAVSEAWMNAADSNPKVKQFLMQATQVGTIGALVGCHVAMAMPLLIDRGVIPVEVAAMAASEAADMNGNGVNGST